MNAWCGYLATNLEGACCRIEQLGDEKRGMMLEEAELHNAIRQLEYRASNKNVNKLEQVIEQLKQDLKERDASIAKLTSDLKEGAAVEMPAEQQYLVSRVLEETLAELGLPPPNTAQDTPAPPDAQARSRTFKRMETATRVALIAATQAMAEGKSQEQKEVERREALSPEGRQAEDMAAMPNWSMDAWLASLDMQTLVCNSILNHVRGAGGNVNPSVELLFMQKLGAAGSRDTVLALLRSSTLLNDITDKLWASILELTRDLEEEKQMREEKKQEEARQAEEEAALEAGRAAYALLLEEEESREIKAWEEKQAAVELQRHQAKQQRMEESKVAAAAAAVEREDLRVAVEATKGEMEQARAELEQAKAQLHARHGQTRVEPAKEGHREDDAFRSQAVGHVATSTEQASPQEGGEANLGTAQMHGSSAGNPARVGPLDNNGETSNEGTREAGHSRPSDRGVDGAVDLKAATGELEVVMTEQEAAQVRELQERLQALEEKAVEASERALQAETREQQRLLKEQKKEEALEKKAEEERAEAQKSRPKKAWGKAGKKAAPKEGKSPAKKTSGIDTKVIHDHIKVSTKAFELSYGTSDVWFRGLARIIGRAGAEAGDNEGLMALMDKEHCKGPDAQSTFEPPNFLIPTTSEIEWHAVVDPVGGLDVLGIREWPKEQRSPTQRQLLPPSSFKKRWDDMNDRLQLIGEAPLQLHGFCCLRLYTGPMYFKYNTVLRGISIPGCKAPLEHKFMALCQGNKYTNTIHSISAAIAKLSRVSKASVVYRAPGGCLPKHFWDDDAAGIKGGVEMGFMSTSTSKDAATEYARMSGVKLLFELKQGMVARGADISWLSMYPNESEILFAPLTACEVQRTRVEGSMLIVELRPGAAPAALMERSIEEKAEDSKIAEETARKEAAERKQAIEEVANRRARWMNSMGGLRVSVAEAKQAASDLATARAEVMTATAEERAAKAQAEADATAKNLKAMNQLKAMEREEREAAERKRNAELAAKERLQKAHEMAEYIKKAALKQRLQAEQEMLRNQIAENKKEREEQEAARQLLAARTLSTSMSAMRMKIASEENGDSIMAEATRKLKEAEEKFQEVVDANTELMEKLDRAVKRAQAAERSQEAAVGNYNKANDEYKIEEVIAIMDKKDPIDMQDKLEGWLSDPLTVRATSERVMHLMKKEKKTNQKKFESIGAIEKTIRAMSGHKNVAAMEAVCTALATLTNASSGQKKAADAGAIPVVVRTIKELQRSGLRTLYNIVQTDPALLDLARQAGAKEEWLLAPKTEEGDDGDDGPAPSPNLSTRKSADTPLSP